MVSVRIICFGGMADVISGTKSYKMAQITCQITGLGALKKYCLPVDTFDHWITSLPIASSTEFTKLTDLPRLLSLIKSLRLLLLISAKSPIIASLTR
jgi:hypothetical protein